MNPDDFIIGQTVFVVLDADRRNFHTEEMQVTKVGRKWVTVGEGRKEKRFDPMTMRLDGKGYSSPGGVYLSAEEWEASTIVGKAWDEFRRRIPYSRPAEVTLDQIKLMRDIIKL